MYKEYDNVTEKNIDFLILTNKCYKYNWIKIFCDPFPLNNSQNIKLFHFTTIITINKTINLSVVWKKKEK